MRMNYDTFLTPLSFIKPCISPQDTYFGTKPIKADERLTITIRFLATGETFRSLHIQFRIGYNTISNIVHQVTEAIRRHKKYMSLSSPRASNFAPASNIFFIFYY